MRVIIDTNVLIVILPAHSKYHRISKKLRDGEVGLIVSFDIILEYEELLKIRYSISSIDEELKDIINSPFTELTTVYYNWNLINVDSDDNKFVDCAIASQADYIVTNDKHFDILSQIPFPKVEVITIQQFENILFDQS